MWASTCICFPRSCFTHIECHKQWFSREISNVQIDFCCRVPPWPFRSSTIDACSMNICFDLRRNKSLEFPPPPVSSEARKPIKTSCEISLERIFFTFSSFVVLSQVRKSFHSATFHSTPVKRLSTLLPRLTMSVNFPRIVWNFAREEKKVGKS
jgi:hypothetical protein